jgi:hypothetical protein
LAGETRFVPWSNATGRGSARQTSGDGEPGPISDNSNNISTASKMQVGDAFCKSKPFQRAAYGLGQQSLAFLFLFDLPRPSSQGEGSKQRNERK